LSVPTKHRRILVTEDPDLAAALDAAAPHVPDARGRAGLVRELVMRGAEALVADEARRAELLEQLIEASTSPDGFDWETLRTVRDTAW
jgi:hypothetical protein